MNLKLDPVTAKFNGLLERYKKQSPAQIHLGHRPQQKSMVLTSPINTSNNDFISPKNKGVFSPINTLTKPLQP